VHAGTQNPYLRLKDNAARLASRLCGEVALGLARRMLIHDQARTVIWDAANKWEEKKTVYALLAWQIILVTCGDGIAPACVPSMELRAIMAEI
jgi:hypothetical protein